uniref:Uncharacterized protein n=1 Tax=Anguilla anguilla TaxID=7936 RepID=A0A0E9X153_ANGAN
MRLTCSKVVSVDFTHFSYIYARFTVYRRHGAIEYILLFHSNIRGERERSPPLTEIMRSRFPHLGNSQGSA